MLSVVLSVSTQTSWGEKPPPLFTAGLSEVAAARQQLRHVEDSQKNQVPKPPGLIEFSLFIVVLFPHAVDYGGPDLSTQQQK